ncbi:uncharacterized protein cubi_01401 [Cryptosporidium ubiquitum]|uniref:Uncharacterized protein n=1 Tax=Cryptosporidium ubiquitum TaxID=857276 RepID=A0A1J4MGC0_9CRYT|nr:uncharacterized protein cubi_01401 [Cryptosporidium ubiquitum]OII72068.1 hypothetical protein cubi_01401 [Cryptosporidium ubiquitum]
MEKLYLISNNGKKRPIYNISKNGSNINVLKHDKIRKTEINHFIENGMACCEDFQVNNTKAIPEKNCQTNRNFIDISHSYIKKTYKIFNEKKDQCILNQYYVKFEENNSESQKLFFPDCKASTKVSDLMDCYSKHLPLNETQLIKHVSCSSKNQFNAFQLYKEVSQLFNQNSLLPIYNEFVLLMSNLLEKQTNYCLIDYIRKESNIVRFFPRYLIYTPQFASQTLNFPFPLDTKLSTSFDDSKYLSPSIHNLAPSCNKCLLPGFHPITAWLLPPSYFEKGGQLKKSSRFLNGMPRNLFNTCFSIKNILTVESTYLLVSNLNKEEFEYCKKENFFLMEEKCKESIYYFDDYKPKIGTEIDEQLTLNNIKFYGHDAFTKNIDHAIQNSIFCGFVSMESANEYRNININNEMKNEYFENNKNSRDLKINSSPFINTTKIIKNGKTFPNILSDCDIFLKNNYNLFNYWSKNMQLSPLEEKIPLLIPRIKCLIKEKRTPDSNLTIIKPCYLLLWNYNIRNCNNTTKDINWINIQCRFARLKYFGEAYETSVPINLNPHKEIILDQLSRIRNVDEARVFAWMLAGCMQYTINELLVDSHTKSLFFNNKYPKITEINYFGNCIKNGPFTGFPDSPLDCHGKIKWNLLKELVES